MSKRDYTDWMSRPFKNAAPFFGAAPRGTAFSTRNAKDPQRGTRVELAKGYSNSLQLRNGIPGGVTPSNRRISTTIEHPGRLSHEQLNAAVSEHVKKIESIKGMREASAARTAEVQKQVADVRERMRGSPGFNEDDHPRDDHGKFTSK